MLSGTRRYLFTRGPAYGVIFIDPISLRLLQAGPLLPPSWVCECGHLNLIGVRNCPTCKRDVILDSVTVHSFLLAVVQAGGSVELISS